MSNIVLEVDLPEELASLAMPEGLHRRLQDLLDKQDQGTALTADERQEAEGLVAVAEFLSLLRMKAKRLGARPS